MVIIHVSRNLPFLNRRCGNHPQTLNPHRLNIISAAELWQKTSARTVFKPTSSKHQRRSLAVI